MNGMETYAKYFGIEQYKYKPFFCQRATADVRRENRMNVEEFHLLNVEESHLMNAGEFHLLKIPRPAA